MLTNTTTTTISTTALTESLIVAYYSLTLMIVGTLLNLLTLILLFRLPFRDRKTRVTLCYMRAIAIFDILMLYSWNLDHYLTAIYGFTLLKYSVPTCKFISFISYFTPQTSAWLRVFICVDRYLSLRRLPRTWYNQPKSVFIIIACIIIVAILLNSHILIFVCYERSNSAIDIQAQSYKVYPLWDYVNLGVSNCAPFILMVIFNSGVICHLIHLRHTTTIQNIRIQRRSITITLVITTFLFLIMTIPGTVAHAFFTDSNPTLLDLLDGILYSYHITSFPLYLVTFSTFRRKCIALFTCKDCNHRIHPQVRPGL